VGVYGADGLRSEELAKLVAPKDPSVITGMKGTAPASAENARFTAALKDFDPKLKELQYAPQAFDCMTIIGLAAQQAKSNNPEIFKNDMISVTKGGTKCSAFADCKRLINNGTDIDYQGVSGPVDLIPAGEPGEATIEVYSYDQSGKLKTEKTVQSTPVG
jgi:branched-chain amino acid transport system substrate-binding protein